MDFAQLANASPALLYLLGLVYIFKSLQGFVNTTIVELKNRIKILEDRLSGEEQEERTRARILMEACNRVLRRVESQLGLEPTTDFQPPEDSHRATLHQNKEEDSDDTHTIHKFKSPTPVDSHAKTVPLKQRRA